MAERVSFHDAIKELFGSNFNLYFQPPESVKLEYPCIVYKRSAGDIKYADNKTYNYLKAYEITVIDKDPDSDIVEQMFVAFPMTRYNRHFVNDNLNHDVFTVYY